MPVPFTCVRRLMASPRVLAYGSAWVALLLPPVMLTGCRGEEAPVGARANAQANVQSNGGGEKPVEQGAALNTAEPVPAEEIMNLGSGFQYDPNDHIPGYEEFVTIRLGNALRIFRAPGNWCPATLALLDHQDNVLASLRLDLPPTGAISGSLPDTAAPCTNIRLIYVVGGLTARKWQRRIGVPEPELTMARIIELNKTARDYEPDTGTEAMLSSHERSLDSNYGSILIVSNSEQLPPGVAAVTTHSAGLVADHMRTEESVPDEIWLSRRVRDVFDDLRKVSRPKGSPAIER